MFSKIFCLIFCLVFTCIATRAQRTVPPTQAEPEIFVIDSNFRVPTKSLPFDRNFKLQFSIPDAKAKVVGFVVVPVNRRGEKAVTRRDYRIYLRTLSPKRDKRKISRNTVSYEQFQDTTVDASIFYKDVAITTKGKKSEVTLLMPQLEPRKNYMVRVYFNDDKVYDLVIGLNKPLFEVLTAKSSVKLDEFNKLKENYDKLAPKDYRADDLFQILSENSFENDVPINIKIEDLVDTNDLKGYAPEVEMRFIFSRGDKSEDQLKALVSERYVTIPSDHIPPRISIAMITAMATAKKLKDADGTAVDFAEDKLQTPYKIYLLASGTRTKIGSSSKPKAFEKVKSVKVTDVVFLGSDPKTIKWKPLPVLPGLKNDEDFIKDLKTAIDYLPTSIENPGKPLISLASYQALIKSAVSCTCKEIGILKESDREELVRVLGFIYNLPEDYVSELLKGQIIPSQPYQAKPKNDAEIINNYESTLKTIDILEGLVRMVPSTVSDASVSSNLMSFVKDLQGTRTLIKTNKTALEDKIKADKKMADYFAAAVNSFETKIAFRGSTEVYNFTTASKFTFHPDFGLVVIPNFSDKLRIREVIPYMGVNINFRSIDRDVPMSSVRNKPWTYYFSFLLGLTLTSLDIQDKREDLFADNSLIAGLGFRLNRYVKVIGGSALFKTYSTNPLSDKKSIGASAFAGVSADFELQELFQGIKKIFK